MFLGKPEVEIARWHLAITQNWTSAQDRLYPYSSTKNHSWTNAQSKLFPYSKILAANKSPQKAPSSQKAPSRHKKKGLKNLKIIPVIVKGRIYCQMKTLLSYLETLKEQLKANVKRLALKNEIK